MLDSNDMAEFLGVSQKVFTQLASTDRVPGPCRLGHGTCLRWSVLELLEWSKQVVQDDTTGSSNEVEVDGTLVDRYSVKSIPLTRL